MDLLYELMDQNIVDKQGERCGRVDDVLVEDVFDRPARVIGLSKPGTAVSAWTASGQVASTPSTR